MAAEWESEGRVGEEGGRVKEVGGGGLIVECLQPVISFLHKGLWWSEPSA